jgi:hypothetical protein
MGEDQGWGKFAFLILLDPRFNPLPLTPSHQGRGNINHDTLKVKNGFAF